STQVFRYLLRSVRYDNGSALMPFLHKFSKRYMQA
ncbi:hypothetical protein ABIB40_004250, partial [Pedobacter sp. UYP30]